jgi:hypothetical protein
MSVTGAALMAVLRDAGVTNCFKRKVYREVGFLFDFRELFFVLLDCYNYFIYTLATNCYRT